MTKESKGYKKKNGNVRKISLCPSEDSRGKYYFTLKLTSAWLYAEGANLDLWAYSKPKNFYLKTDSFWEKLAQCEIPATHVYIWLWKQVPSKSYQSAYSDPAIFGDVQPSSCLITLPSQYSR